MVPPLTVHGVERDPDWLRFLVSVARGGIRGSREKRHPHGFFVCILMRVQSFNDPL